MKRKASAPAPAAAADDTTVIRFYSKKANPKYAALSNFSAHPITIDGVEWPATEHYYQAQKYAVYADPLPHQKHRELIRTTKNPIKAKSLGRCKDPPIRSDWETAKDGVMLKALRAKFSQHQDMQELLLETGDKTLEEASPTDYYWGTGRTGTGKDRLGVLLMQVSTELRSQKDDTVNNNNKKAKSDREENAAAVVY